MPYKAYTLNEIHTVFDRGQETDVTYQILDVDTFESPAHIDAAINKNQIPTPIFIVYERDE